MPVFDVGDDSDVGDTGPAEMCKVVDDMDAVGECEAKAPPESFEPDVQWEFMGPQGFNESIATPLVINLTDDNDDGEIDLCDIPDVVVVAGPAVLSDTSPSRLYVLDGETGTPHFFLSELVQFASTPAAGDIDGDGLPEIVAVSPGSSGNLMAFEHDGTLKWKSAHLWVSAQSSAIGLADLDADGDVEIFAGSQVYDHQGNWLWQAGPDHIYSASTAADLDGDGELEVLTGPAAHHANGSPYWNSAAASGGWPFPQVADLDDDGLPEVLVSTSGGLTLLQHDGAVVWQSWKPTADGYDWDRPINIHDFDADGLPEFGASAPAHYGVYQPDQTTLWVQNIVDSSGQAGGTAFDFLGSGKAQTVYADEYQLFVLDEAGQPLLSTPRLSGTVIEYPTVADIDDDGSAEILVVSNTLLVGGQLEFTIKAVRDQQDRWIQARRIWNQHAYHVTNVREDGTIPQVQPKNWESLNTFRTQAQIEGGGVCKPDPEG
jgi:hypothetical protein